MLILLRIKWLQLSQSVRQGGKGKWLLFVGLGLFFMLVLGFFTLRVFGYLYDLKDIPFALKLFLAEKLMFMVFMTLFSLLVLSALIASLEVLFLSKDIGFLLSTPLRSRTIFISKSVEALVISSLMAVFFSLPMLFSFCRYFAPNVVQGIQVALSFLLYTFCGATIGLILGLLIPVIFSVRRMQTILSVVSVALISLIVIFIRLSSPERLLNPNEINEVFTFIASLKLKSLFNYFPFHWLARSLNAAAEGNWKLYLFMTGLLAGFAVLLTLALMILESRFYLPVMDQLVREGGSRYRSGWKPLDRGRGYLALWQKEIKTFFRSPSQWSQLLVIVALLAVFVINTRMIPIPHKSVRTLVGLLNLWLIAFMTAGISSRFTLPAIPGEGPGVIHLVASPMPRKRFLHFKFLFYLVPQLFIAGILFGAVHWILHFDRLELWLGIVFILPGTVLLTLMSFYFGLQITELTPLSPQHVIVSRKGLSFMLWSMIYIAFCLVFLARPLFLYYVAPMFHHRVPFLELEAWLAAFFLIHAALIAILYRRSLRFWLQRQF